MVTLYPDTLSYFCEPVATRTAEGFYEETASGSGSGSGYYSTAGICRIEYASPSAQMSGNDKKGTNHTATVYAPLTLGTLPEKGQKVKIVKHDNTEIEGTVVNAERGLLHIRIWIEE